MKSIIWRAGLALLTTYPISVMANPFDDGNNLSGLFTRLARIIRSALINTEILIIAGGLIAVACGLILMMKANKLQISPRYGATLALIGFLLASPRACSSMSSKDILNTDQTQVVETLLNEQIGTNEDIILPN